MFVKPIDRLTINQAEDYSKPFHLSSRINAFQKRSSKSIGASCNYFIVPDSIEGIGEARAWALQVLSYQGAPSLDFSLLRPKDSPVNTGGVSSGAVSFMRGYDQDVHTMRRPEKKNGAGIVYLDWQHPELDEFLKWEPLSVFKAVWVPMHDTDEAKEFLNNEEIVKKLADAYNNFKTFLVKRPLRVNDEALGVNLCTEVTIPHRGFCILGAINLAAVEPKEYYRVFLVAAQELLGITEEVNEAAKGTALYCDSPANKQFGLGVFGLATAIGKLGISYKYLADYLQYLFKTSPSEDIYTIVSLANALKGCGKVEDFTYHLLNGYKVATKVAEGKVRAAFCIQPTVSTSQRSLCMDGFTASPEIAPVEGIRNEEAVSTFLQSALKGSKVIDYHRDTLTMEDVPYEDYALLSSMMQKVMISTGLAHRHSHCFYGESFRVQDLLDFYQGAKRHRESLYYRLPFQVNRDAMDKSKLWQDVLEGELFEGSLDFLQVPGRIECDCTM